MPYELRPEQVKANFERGVLHISIPKDGERLPRSFEVKLGSGSAKELEAEPAVDAAPQGAEPAQAQSDRPLGEKQSSTATPSSSSSSSQSSAQEATPGDKKAYKWK